MITTMFYYNHYKPYMFKSKRNEAAKDVSSTQAQAHQQKNTDTQQTSGLGVDKRLLLNKTLNKDVVKYAQGVSYSLTSLKDAVKYVGYDVDDFEKNTRKYGVSDTKESLKSDMATFVNAFNKAHEFYLNQGHSQSLVDFSIDIDNVVISNSGVLRDLGINIDEDENITFSPDVIDRLSVDELKSSLYEAEDVFKSIYKRSNSMMTVPLAEHMNFKSLNYYYNYKYGGLVSDTFKMIESGMIIDKVV